MSKVLLIDDDQEFTGLLSEYLTDEGFSVVSTDDGASGAQKAIDNEADIVVLDVMIPRMDGFAVLRYIRETSDLPVLMLTARGDDLDRINGLDLGADDYVAKPCTPAELVARIKAILRRTGKRQILSETLQNGDLVLVTGSRQALLKNSPLTLTGTEYNLLEMLVRQSGKVVSKQEISQTVFGRPLTPFDRRIDVHLSSVRQKLGSRPDGQSWIQAVRGQGYILLQDI
ncbi:response regulator transcription factor [Allorhizobium sp. BGMRC 0089]|uniref:response regulator transcription factor n=1 Tax=Allorhizobium sonneratiae TaxID=2934936 RepID=UPI00203374DB|nr:response regulator transcription factor [Allorhizobium sonneratiae]MCM2293236.1 response regulator transcription factor [Allorhizobium sonneratiae]